MFVSFHFDSPEHPEVSVQILEGFPRQQRPRRWLFGNHKDPRVLVALSCQGLAHVCTLVSGSVYVCVCVCESAAGALTEAERRLLKTGVQMTPAAAC